MHSKAMSVTTDDWSAFPSMAQGPKATFFNMNRSWESFMLRLWRFLPAGTRCHPTIWSASKQQGFRLASSASAICKVQRLCEKLEQLQSRVVCPKRTSFTEGGEVYQLPLKVAMPRAAPPTRKELDYLVGFFDGDGSVSLNGTEKVSLQVDQNIDGARVLLRFRAAFGGGIYISHHATGRAKAVLKWQVRAAKASAAAKLLASVPSMKQAQLEIASPGKALQADLSMHARPLDALKSKDHMPAGLECSWAYLAGFFDADGCITVSSGSAGLALQVLQKNQFMLASVHEFLHQQGLVCRLYKTRRLYIRLQCSDFLTCKQILKNLLMNGLDVKKEQAQLALTLTATNHVQIREQLSKLKGHQSRYRGLDEAGMNRAKEINKIRSRLRSTTSQQAKAKMEEELQALLQEHSREKLLCKARMLKVDIRKLLREGATIQPLVSP